MMQNSLGTARRTDHSEIGLVLLIGGNEFHRVVRHPLVIIVSLILLVLAVINGIGSAVTLTAHPVIVNPGEDVFILYGVGQVFFVILEFCSVMALFIGAMSIAEESTGRSTSIIITKPLYRRDVIAGKFLGLNAFMLLLVTPNFILSSIFLAIFYGAPAAMTDFVLRFSAFVLSVFLYCSITIAIAMLIGIIFKDLLQAAVVAITYYSADFNGSLNGYLGSLGTYTPQNLFSKITSESGLQNTTASLSSWLSAALPYIVMIVLEILAILIIGLLIFSRSDE